MHYANGQGGVICLVPPGSGVAMGEALVTAPTEDTTHHPDGSYTTVVTPIASYGPLAGCFMGQRGLLGEHPNNYDAYMTDNRSQFDGRVLLCATLDDYYTNPVQYEERFGFFVVDAPKSAVPADNGGLPVAALREWRPAVVYPTPVTVVHYTKHFFYTFGDVGHRDHIAYAMVAMGSYSQFVSYTNRNIYTLANAIGIGTGTDTETTINNVRFVSGFMGTYYPAGYVRVQKQTISGRDVSQYKVGDLLSIGELIYSNGSMSSGVMYKRTIGEVVTDGNYLNLYLAQNELPIPFPEGQTLSVLCAVGVPYRKSTPTLKSLSTSPSPVAPMVLGDMFSQYEVLLSYEGTVDASVELKFTSTTVYDVKVNNVLVGSSSITELFEYRDATTGRLKFSLPPAVFKYSAYTVNRTFTFNTTSGYIPVWEMFAITSGNSALVYPGSVSIERKRL